MKSPLGTLLKLRNASKSPIPLDTGRAYRRGLSFNLGNGRQDAETFMRQYGMSGTLFGIVSLLAESAATPTWRLYRKPPADGRVRYTTADQGSDQRIQVVQHAAIQLWNSPNDWHSGFEFREGAQLHQELTGETFWVLDMDAGFPTSMWYVRPDRMEPVPDPDQFLLGWIYTGPTGEQIPLKADEVILEKRPDPLDPYRGAGPVASILPNIQQQRYATEYQRNLFLNGADPGGIITVPNTLTEPQFDELIDRWRESHRGVARAGQIGVLENGASWTPGSHTNKDLEYGQLRLANRDELREAWRIHKAMMGTSDDVNRANAQTAQEVFVAWQVMPRLNRRRDTLNSKLLPLFGNADRVNEFDYDDPSPVNAETAASELLAKAQAAQALLTPGVFNPRDVLEAVGLPDMDVIDVAAAAKPPTPQPALRAPEALEDRARERITVRAALPPGPSATPTPAETPAQQPPAQIQQVDTQWKAAVALLVTAWLAHIMPGWYAALLTQIRQQIGADNLIGLAALQVPPDLVTDAADLIVDHTTAYAHAAAKQAAAEAAAQGTTGVQPHTPSPQALETAAHTAARLQAQQVATSAGREAARVAGADPDADDVVAHVKAFLDGLSDASVTTAASGVMSAAQNGARLATIAAGPRAQLVATEMHDTNTCDPCDEVNGKVFGFSDDPAAVAEAEAAYPAGGYVACEGGPRCRGTLWGDYSAPSAKNRAALGPRAGKDAQAKVFSQLAGDFPPSATAWVHHASWSGPADVPLAHIDWTPAGMEGADPKLVQQLVAKRQAGKKLKPVILVKTPGSDRLQLADGHHHYLAAAELDEPVRGFIGTVDADHGPWEQMHAQQYRSHNRAAQASAAAVLLSKTAVNYRPATETARRCGTCSMFQAPGACTLVAGFIDTDGVCDRWAPASGEQQMTDFSGFLRRVLVDGYVPVQTAGRQ